MNAAPVRTRLRLTVVGLALLAAVTYAIVRWCREADAPAPVSRGPKPGSARPPAAQRTTPPPRLERHRYAWGPSGATESLASRIPAPTGYRRRPMQPGSFASWLRGLPLRTGRPPVRLHDGRAKGNQAVHHAVIDIDCGRRDLQQCADAVIRLRAEYLWHAGRRDAIAFRFTSGDPARWSDWRDGQRPRIRGNRVTWSRSAPRDASRRSFRRYLDTVFTYAGTRSLARELAPVADPSLVVAGDVFIQGGSPGHAVLVVDTAENERGERLMLLAQSYMPAQDVHVLVNRNDGAPSPWYAAKRTGDLVTPEWRFRHENLRRFR